MNREEKIDIITFVHGTFDNNARWTKNESDVFLVFRKHFGHNAVYHNFNWSGENDIYSREVAARQLKSEIEANYQYYPKCRQYFIGHSHGGNIIINAINNLSKEYREKVNGIITVSTPFMQFRKRKIHLEVEAYLLFIFISLSILPFLVIARFTTLITAKYIIELEPFPSVILLLIAARITQVFYKRLCNEGEINNLNSKQKSIAEKYSTNIQYKIPIGCIYTNYDEIKYIFLFGLFLRKIMKVINNIFAGFMLIILFLKKIANFLPGISIIMIFFILIVVYMGTLSMNDPLGEMVGKLFILCLVIFIPYSLSILISFLVGYYIFGARRILEIFSVDVEFSMHPPNASNIIIKKKDSICILVKKTSKSAHTGIIYEESIKDDIQEILTELVKEK